MSAEGVRTDPTKITAVQSWATLTNVKQVGVFLRLTGYYRKFIKNYGIISRTLLDLLKKDRPWTWGHLEEEAFQALKLAMTQAPILALPDFKERFTIEIDASKNETGAVLMQKGHSIAYLSKDLGPKAQGLSTFEK